MLNLYPQNFKELQFRNFRYHPGDEQEYEKGRLMIKINSKFG